MARFSATGYETPYHEFSGSRDVQRVHWIVKKSMFKVALSLPSAMVSGRKINVAASLVFADSRAEVTLLKGDPLEYETFVDMGASQAVLSCKMFVLSSKHEGRLFRIQVEGKDGGDPIVSEPFKVVSKMRQIRKQRDLKEGKKAASKTRKREPTAAPATQGARKKRRQRSSPRNEAARKALGDLEGGEAFEPMELDEDSPFPESEVEEYLPERRNDLGKAPRSAQMDRIEEEQRQQTMLLQKIQSALEIYSDPSFLDVSPPPPSPLHGYNPDPTAMFAMLDVVQQPAVAPPPAFQGGDIVAKFLDLIHAFHETPVGHRQFVVNKMVKATNPARLGAVVDALCNAQNKLFAVPAVRTAPPDFSSMLSPPLGHISADVSF